MSPALVARIGADAAAALHYAHELLGPSGNLRAPTVRRGRTLVVGFDEATYAAQLT